MCSICNSFLCPDERPSYGGEAIYVCGCCGSGICEGERYYRVGRSCFHKECLTDNYCNEELLKLFGATPRVATRKGIGVSIIGVANGK